MAREAEWAFAQRRRDWTHRKVVLRGLWLLIDGGGPRRKRQTLLRGSEGLTRDDGDGRELDDGESSCVGSIGVLRVLDRVVHVSTFRRRSKNLIVRDPCVLEL